MVYVMMEMKMMIISDTHDNIPAIRKILGIANRTNPDLVIHCGDYISPFTISEFIRSGVKMIGVWGNNDGDKPTILSRIKDTDINIYPQPYIAKIGNINIFICHGWGSIEKTKKLVYSLAKQEVGDIVIYGHIHSPDISLIKTNEVVHDICRIGQTVELNREDFKTLIINPGEVCGYLSGTKSYVLMEINERIKVSLCSI